MLELDDEWKIFKNIFVIEKMFLAKTFPSI